MQWNSSCRERILFSTKSVSAFSVDVQFDNIDALISQNWMCWGSRTLPGFHM